MATERITIDGVLEDASGRLLHPREMDYRPYPRRDEEPDPMESLDLRIAQKMLEQADREIAASMAETPVLSEEGEVIGKLVEIRGVMSMEAVQAYCDLSERGQAAVNLLLAADEADTPAIVDARPKPACFLVEDDPWDGKLLGSQVVVDGDSYKKAVLKASVPGKLGWKPATLEEMRRVKEPDDDKEGKEGCEVHLELDRHALQSKIRGKLEGMAREQGQQRCQAALEKIVARQGSDSPVPPVRTSGTACPLAQAIACAKQAQALVRALHWPESDELAQRAIWQALTDLMRSIESLSRIRAG